MWRKWQSSLRRFSQIWLYTLVVFKFLVLNSFFWRNFRLKKKKIVMAPNDFL
jgi:hypothetical protein